MEKFFSVVVETADGKSKTLPARGNSSNEVYKQMKHAAGVHRVGKVREISSHEHDALSHGKPIAHAPRPAAVAETPAPAHAHRPGGIPHTISGPRVVMHDRRTGGEQPFRHLKTPPERPKPIKPHEPARHEPPAKQPAEPAPQKKHVHPLEYRITKSRRQEGQPYLLQRGYWLEQKGKRVFTVEWEKGFPDREKAAKHEAWVKRSEQEMSEVEE